MKKSVPQTDFNKALSIIERIETLQAQQRDIQDCISDILKEAKDEGFNTKALKEIIKMRKLDANEIAENDFWIKKLRSVVGL